MNNQDTPTINKMKITSTNQITILNMSSKGKMHESYPYLK